jgi:cell division protein FtsB
MTGRRWLLIGVVALALLFALQGGEYSSLALLALKREVKREQSRVAELHRVVDSLARYARRVETDPGTQERIAREIHGMLKPGEHAFILEDEPTRKP